MKKQLFLPLLILLILFAAGFSTIAIINFKNQKKREIKLEQSRDVSPKTVEGVSTRSAWIKGSKEVAPTLSFSIQEHQNVITQYPVEPETEAGRDVGGAGSETYTYPIYVEQAPIIKPSYETIYIEGIGLSYSCLASRISEIKQADQDYLNEREEVAGICAVNDSTQYEICANNCSVENFETCERDCYNQIDWNCSVDVTLSPEYRNLSHVLSMYCK